MVFLLKLTICWGFFALLYSLLLRKETFFVANRVYLLGTMAAGVVLAACPNLIPAYKEANGIHVIALPAVSAGFHQAAEASRQLKGMDYIWMVYFLGVAGMLARTGWGIYRLVGMARAGNAEPLPGGTVLIRSAAVTTPFSFFKWIFVPAENREDLPDDGAQHILAHERAHAEGWHSVDVMLLELVCALFWFHPLAHWYRRSLRTVHEYLADAHASRLTDKKQYGLLLIRQSQSGMPVAFANHFFQSPLKQRLIMLMKKHSPRARAFRYTLVLPLAALFVLLFQQAPVLAQEVKSAYIDASPKPTTIAIGMMDNNPEPFLRPTDCNKAPEYIGGMNAMAQFISKNLQYPNPVDGIYQEGTVVVSFTIKEDGYLKDVHLTEMAAEDRTLPAAYEAEALRVISMLPQWTPGKKDCKPAAFELCVPIKFKTDGASATSSAGDQVMDLFDVQSVPQFPGGDKAMMDYFVQNIKYPENIKNDTQVSSKVIAYRFVVEKDGSVSNIEVLNGAGFDERLVAEGVRAIGAMPKWAPGMKDGALARVYFTLPIRFKLK